MKLPLLVSLFTTGLSLAQVADPKEHPYADPAGGREAYALSGETVNESRLYNFYQRQADYYMAMDRKEVPQLLPAYPGLDGGGHGHWGKHSQNNHKDERWNQIDHGPVVAHVFRDKKFALLKALCVKLGKKNELSAAFDTQTLSWRAIWQGGFVKFDGFRWGGSRNAAPVGEMWFQDEETRGWAGNSEGRFRGFYRHGEDIVLSYEIDGVPILDHATATTPEDSPPHFHRILEFPEGVPAKGLILRAGTKVTGNVLYDRNAALKEDASGGLWLHVGAQAKGAVLSVVLRRDDAEFAKESLLKSLSPMTKGATARFARQLEVTGSLAPNDKPYVVDTIPVPFDNPYKTVMQLTGIAFLPDGDALVTVWCGEVWRVSGLQGDLAKVTWRRVATGFNQPIGVHIDEDGVFVLDRGRITRLHDLNDDGEYDYFENYADDFGGYNRSHTHTFGLIRTPDKAFHFVQREDILRTSAFSQDRPGSPRGAQLHGGGPLPGSLLHRAAGGDLDPGFRHHRGASRRILRSRWRQVPRPRDLPRRFATSRAGWTTPPAAWWRSPMTIGDR